MCHGRPQCPAHGEQQAQRAARCAWAHGQAAACLGDAHTVTNSPTTCISQRGSQHEAPVTVQRLRPSPLEPDAEWTPAAPGARNVPETGRPPLSERAAPCWGTEGTSVCVRRSGADPTAHIACAVKCPGQVWAPVADLAGCSLPPLSLASARDSLHDSTEPRAQLGVTLQFFSCLSALSSRTISK